MTVVDDRVGITDQILEQLVPFIARQRQALVQQGCFRQISSTHLHVLYMLASRGSLPMSRLADQLDVSLPNVTGIVERMVERGFVERIRLEDDRRVVEVGITAAGRQIVDEIDMIKRQEMAKIIDRLTPEQQAQALQTFTLLRLAAEDLQTEETTSPGRAQPQGEAAN